MSHRSLRLQFYGTLSLRQGVGVLPDPSYTSPTVCDEKEPNSHTRTILSVSLDMKHQYRTNQMTTTWGADHTADRETMKPTAPALFNSMECFQRKVERNWSWCSEFHQPWPMTLTEMNETTPKHFRTQLHLFSCRATRQDDSYSDEHQPYNRWEKVWFCLYSCPQL